MLIAQALGEYAAVSTLIDAFSTATVRLEEMVGGWGTEGLVLVVVAAVLWKLIMGHR